MALANVVNIFAHELILLSGERMQYDFHYDYEMISDMNDSVIHLGGPPPDVRVYQWDDLMWAMGAAAFAMEGVTDIALQEISPDAQ